MMRQPTIAIVGRPNVGKSTLYNRLTGRRTALVHDQPGVTRDRREGNAELFDLSFRLVDTAGLEEANPETLAGRMRMQTEAAIEMADVLLFVVDVRAGMTTLDQSFAASIRKLGKPTIVLANKAEGKSAASGLNEAYRLGLGEPIEFSGEHGIGLIDLRDALVAAWPPFSQEDDEPSEDTGSDEIASDEDHEHQVAADRAIKVTIIGRPNVGKSTLVNRLLGYERLLTSPEAGTTRDAIAVELEMGGQRFELIDTAGLRRKSRVQDPVERLATADTLNSLKFAEVAVVMFDAERAFEEQDLRIADLVEREGRALVIVINKWDLVEKRGGKIGEWRENLERLLPQIKGVSLIALSGLTGEGIERLSGAIVEAYNLWNKRISTARLNRWLEDALEEHAPPAAKGRRIRLRYITQSKTRPPTFIAFCSRPEELPESYTRYLTNSLRSVFKLGGTPIRLLLRKGDNPYKKD